MDSYQELARRLLALLLVRLSHGDRVLFAVTGVALLGLSAWHGLLVGRAGSAAEACHELRDERAVCG